MLRANGPRFAQALPGIVFLALCVGKVSPVSAAEPQKNATPSILMPEPLAEDERGFVSIFDGKTLHGWDGDPTYWRVEGDSLVGETTQLTNHNSFIIWQGGLTKDFELKLQYRISPGGNSGINYRSEAQTDPKWTMRGYQFDIDGPQWGRNALRPQLKDLAALDQFIHFRVTGQNYEELGRQFLALPGQFTYVATGEPARVIGRVGYATQIEDVARDDWNDVHIIARGNLLIHILNGHVISVVMDDDLKNRQLEGKLGVQVHVGPPMKVEFRNIRLKTL
jgi:hypothetical protein